jgi:hypothetical protein
VAKTAGIDPKARSAYQAHVEGRVEERNWLVEILLREMCYVDIPGWPEMLPWVEFAINSSPYSVGMTPYFHKTGYGPISCGARPARTAASYCRHGNSCTIFRRLHTILQKLFTTKGSAEREAPHSA